MDKPRHECYRFYSIEGFAERFVSIDDFGILLAERDRLKRAVSDALEIYKSHDPDPSSVARQMAACLEDL